MEDINIYYIMFSSLVRSETHLDLDKFKLEQVCTSREYKHRWEELGIWLHLKIYIYYIHIMYKLKIIYVHMRFTGFNMHQNKTRVLQHKIIGTNY